MGGGARLKRRVVLEHAVVACVGDVEVAVSVHRNPKRVGEAVRTHPAVIRGIRSKDAVLPEHHICGPPNAGKRTASGEWGVVFEHPAVDIVGDVEVAACVHRNPVGIAQAAPAYAAGVARVRVKVRLTNDQVGRSAIGERRHIVPAQHPRVTVIRDIKPVGRCAGVDRDREWIVKRVLVREVWQVVQKVRLPQHNIGDVVARDGGSRQGCGYDQQARRCEFPKSRFEHHDSPAKTAVTPRAVRVRPSFANLWI